MSPLIYAARLLCFAVAIAASALPTRGEAYPSRPVKVIVQTAAGSSLDVLARIVNEQLSRIWGQDVIVVNQAGAGGLNAARLAAASAPDGYTLFLAGGSVFVALPELHRNLPFDVNDFAPIGFVADEPYSILVSSRLNVKSIPELIAASKQQPGGLNAVAGTVGGLQHLTAERFREVSGAHLNMIHYPGTAQSLGDVISGRVPVMFQNLLPVAGVMHSGEVRLLAIAASSRLPNFPAVPTVAETLPGFIASGWSVMVAPHGTPPAIVQKINSDLRRALQAPALLKKFQDLGNYTNPMSPQELSDYIAVQRREWRPIVQKVAAESQ
jgi:tripartite-type tricarboxylate transporter receptor subunit TctC